MLRSNSTVSPGTWQQVKIGGGGYVTGIDISADGTTVVCRTDTYGAYRFNFITNKWEQLITSTSFAGSALDDRSQGVEEIRVAPNDPNRLYMMYQGDVWKSSDKGSTWTATGLNYSTRQSWTGQNDTSRFMGQKMAVDPNNHDIVYMGTKTAGVKFTTDGGSSWSSISTGTIPACATLFSGSNPGHPGIVFDGSATIYIPVYGTGVYQSTDSGSTWSELNTANMPTKVCHAQISIDHVYYCSNVDASTANTFYKYSSGWTNISSGCAAGSASTPASILPDPSDATRIVAVSGGGQLQLNTNGGASGSWKSLLANHPRSSDDIPWLAWTNENFMSLGDAVFDGSGNIWLAEGIGVWTTPFAGIPSSMTWTSKTQGIENLTVNQILCPPNGKPLAANWDRSVFRIQDPSVYPSTHSPDNIRSIRMAWGVDYAKDNPSFVAYSSLYASPGNQWGWYSTDGGITWTVFSGAPSGGNIVVVPNKQGGTIACATSNNIIIVPSDNALPWYTLDGGATWNEIVIPGVPTSGITGWGNAAFSRNGAVTADYVNIGTFYLYNYITFKVYKSTDGGVTWDGGGSTVDTQAVVGNYKLVSVPDNAGHLFISGGGAGNPGDVNPGATKLQRSTDGGATWTRVGPTSGNGTIKEPYCIGFGKVKAGQSYPAIYFAGWLQVAGTFTNGIWRSFDNCSTWESVGQYPVTLGTIKDIDGSKEIYGLLFAAVSGNSYIWRTAD